MRFLLPMLILFLVLPLPAAASEIEAPTIPEYTPDSTASFGESLMNLLQRALYALQPAYQDALQICLSLIVAVMAVGILQTASGNLKSVTAMAGTAYIAGTLLYSTNTMIHLGADTIQEMSEYGKLLYPVMTAALAAQGGITASAALYAGTAAFISILGSLISKLLLPLVYIFLALAAADSIFPDSFMKQMKGLVKNFVSWCLKIILTVFTTYLSITGVVSGTTDAAALKAAKVTISSVVPVVGSILSDASESVLVSAALAKNAAGIYGILAVLALFLSPFLRIAVQYLVLKFTSSICSIFGEKSMTGLIDDFSSAMGLILGMTGSVCLLLLISTICYMKGVG